MHAFLSASDHSWVNYDEDKLARVYHTRQAARRGTELHALAHSMIRLGVKLPDDGKTLSAYVNDGIGYRMDTEVTFVYSDNVFGTADCAAFRRNKLRVHDLKTGVTPASMAQLEVYAAFFCLEYKYKPFEIEIELRIYQNDEIVVHEPDPDVIFHIMDRAVTFDKYINYPRSEAE